ncbi:hypothetical protein PG984_012214 [Apiospora sp. TS-2023a]
MAPPVRCAPELQDLALWRQHESQLRELYLDRNQTLAQVKQSMEQQYSWPEFKLGTYEVILRDELGLVKNLKKEDWVAIQHRIKKRERIPKPSEVIFRGRVIDRKRIVKECRRYNHAAIFNGARSPVLRAGIVIKTPPLSPRPQLASRSVVSNEASNPVIPSSNNLDEAEAVFLEDQGDLSIRRWDCAVDERKINQILMAAPFRSFVLKLQETWVSSIRLSGGTHDSVFIPSTSMALHDIQELPYKVRSQDSDIMCLWSQNTIARQSCSNAPVDLFESTLQACYMFSNNLLDEETSNDYLELVLQIANRNLLGRLFSLRMPTVTGTWQNSILIAYKSQHAGAFDILLEIGLAEENIKRVMWTRHAVYFAMAVDLGSRKAAKSVHRLLECGVSPDTNFLRSMPSHLKRSHTWQSSSLEQAAKNSDAGMLEILIKAGACTSGRGIDYEYGNEIICNVVRSVGTSSTRHHCLQCVEVLINAGMKVDFTPFRGDHSWMPPRGLPHFPSLLIDRLIVSGDKVHRKIYHLIAPHSEWAQTRVTVSGIFLATEGGCAEIQRYLDAVSVPDDIKQELLQLSLSLAVFWHANAVMDCLLQFGATRTQLPRQWHYIGIICDPDYQERDDRAEFKPAIPLHRKLQQRGITFNNVSDMNTLHMALRKGCNFATPPYLIENGVEVHSFLLKNDEGPSEYKSYKFFIDRSRVVDILISNGADMNILSSTGISVLEASLYGPCRERTYSDSKIWACKDEHLKVFWKLFWLTGPHTASSLTFTLRSLISMLIQLGDSDANICTVLDVGLDLDTNPDCQSGGESRVSLLIQAIQEHRVPLAKQLIQRGCDVSQQMSALPGWCRENIVFNTAIEAACEHMSDTDLVSMLIEKGAEVNPPPSAAGSTPLHRAAYKGSLANASLLLKKAADINAKPGRCYRTDIRPTTSVRPTYHYRPSDSWLQAVDVAAYAGHLDMVQLLVEAGGFSGQPGRTGLDGALGIAKVYQHYGVLEYLQWHMISEEMRRSHVIFTDDNHSCAAELDSDSDRDETDGNDDYVSECSRTEV